jgi:putative RecB family exonuclease
MKNHLSYTQINTYMLCPLKYFFQYIEQIAWPFKPEALVFGTAIHRALEHYYLGRKEDRDVPVEELLAIFQAAWEHEESDNTIRYKNGNTAEKLLQSARTMLETFLASVTPGKVLGVEEHFSVELINPATQESLGIPIEGRIDLIEQLPEGTIAVVDQKTACRPYNADKIAHDLQLTAYSYVMAQQGHDTNDMIQRFDVLLKNGTHKFISYQARRTEQDHVRFFKIAKSVLNGIQAGTFFPNRCFMCNDCTFAEPCKQW